MFGDRLTIEQLVEIRDRNADACVSVLADPDADVNGPKGAASPVQFGQVLSWIAVLADEEIKRREADGTV